MQHIPSTIIYVAQPAKPAEHFGIKDLEIPLCPTYVVNGESKSALKTAQNRMGEPREEVTVLNEEIEYVRVLHHVTWCHRGGSDAFRVAINDKYIVDMSSSAMCDAVKYSKAENRLLYGPFRWVVDGSLGLMHVASPRYQKALEETERRNAAKIGARKLKIGAVYESVHHHRYLYLGRVDTEHLNCHASWQQRSAYYASGKDEVTCTYTIGPKTERHCFMHVYEGLSQEHVQRYIETGKDKTFNKLEVRTIPDLVNEVATFDVTGLMEAAHKNEISKADDNYCYRTGYILLMRRKGEPRPKMPSGEMGDAINAIK